MIRWVAVVVIETVKGEFVAQYANAVRASTWQDAFDMLVKAAHVQYGFEYRVKVENLRQRTP